MPQWRPESIDTVHINYLRYCTCIQKHSWLQKTDKLSYLASKTTKYINDAKECEIAKCVYIFRPVYPYDFGIKCTLFRCFLQLSAGLVKIMIFVILSGVVYCFNIAWMKVFLAEGNKKQEC